jgi:hypothetical protein
MVPLPVCFSMSCKCVCGDHLGRRLSPKLQLCVLYWYVTKTHSHKFLKRNFNCKMCFLLICEYRCQKLIQARFRRTGRFDVSLCFLSKHYGWFEMPKITSWSLSRRMRAVGLSVSCHVAKSSVWRSASYKLKNNEQGESE